VWAIARSRPIDGQACTTAPCSMCFVGSRLAGAPVQMVHGTGIMVCGLLAGDVVGYCTTLFYDLRSPVTAPPQNQDWPLMQMNHNIRTRRLDVV